MKRIEKTAEQILRDELILKTRESKGALEHAVIKVKRCAKVLEFLPTDCREHKEADCNYACAKWDVLAALRQYETDREILEEHCKTYHLAGNTFINGMQLLELLDNK